MTTQPAPRTPRQPIALEDGSPGPIDALLELHDAGVVKLPPAFLGAVAAADTLTRAAGPLGAEFTRERDRSTDVRRLDMDAAKNAARTGSVPADTGAAFVAHGQLVVDLGIRYQLVKDAASEAANEVRAAVVNGADALGDMLAAALARTLAEAEAPASVMRAAEPFGWTRPDALLAAGAPVQAAYGALAPLARVHDSIRAAAVALAVYAPAWEGLGSVKATFDARQRAAVPGADPEWRRCSPLAGYGAEQDLANSRDRPWVFRPVGHPVQRLVRAATDPELPPIVEPVAEPTGRVAAYRLV